MSDDESIVAFAFYRDDSRFPNVRAKSVRERMAVYWRCMAASAATIRRYSMCNCQILIFTNDEPPDEVVDLLQASGVWLIDIPFGRASLAGKQYGAAFYLLDAVDQLALILGPDQVCALLDPDCIVVNPLGKFFELVRSSGRVLYEVPYPPKYSINGLNRSDLRLMHQTVIHGQDHRLPKWIGGELLGFRGDQFKTFSDELATTIAYLDSAGELNKIRTEEQLISLSVHGSPEQYSAANMEHVARIWTFRRHRSYGPWVLETPIWHLPAEKQSGLPRVLNYVNSKGELPVSNSEVQELAKLVGISGPSFNELTFLCYQFGVTIRKALTGRLNSFR